MLKLKKILIILCLLFTTNYSHAFDGINHGKATAKAMTNSSSQYFKAHGIEKGINEIHRQDGTFREGEMYVFLFNYKTGILAGHGAYKSLVGRNLMDMKDVDGKMLFHEFKKIAETKGEGWVEYKWPNPVTKKIEQKNSFIKKLDDKFLVGCGYYKN